MTEPRSVVYRGASRNDVERQYHAGARAAVDEGYVPAGEDWSNALGQDVLSVRYVYDPEQGSAVLRALDAAERESRIAASALRVATPYLAGPAMAPAEAKSKSNNLRKVLIALVLVFGAVAVWQSGLLNGGSLPIPGVGTTANVPPTRQIWFGTSFNPNTFAISGRTSTTKVGGTVAAVATLPQSIATGEANMRVTLDGEVVALQVITMSGSGELFGVTLGPYFIAGAYKYEILDLGGNVLASGSLTVTE